MDYKQKFIAFLAECGVLKFGTFKLKSGRIAPYFLNAGEYKTGAQIKRLGEFYADCIHENGIEVETLFGPAYKGVPLALSAAVALYEKYGQDVNFCFDRKEVKDHGEGGAMVPYSTANKAAVVNAGLEIIATLSHHYGVRLPIVVDNAESVTELLPVDSQVIRLVVSAEDESLRVEVDK